MAQTTLSAIRIGLALYAIGQILIGGYARAISVWPVETRLLSQVYESIYFLALVLLLLAWNTQRGDGENEG